MIRALVIEPSGFRYVYRLSENLQIQSEQMKSILGGWLEPLSIVSEHPFIIWCNEEGYRLDLPFNPLASLIAIAYTPVILGNAILTGPPDANGDITALHKSLVNVLLVEAE